MKSKYLILTTILLMGCGEQKQCPDEIVKQYQSLFSQCLDKTRSDTISGDHNEDRDSAIKACESTAAMVSGIVKQNSIISCEILSVTQKRKIYE